MVALPKTVVHCAGRSLYHRIKTWFWRCLPSMPRAFPYHGKSLCLSITTCSCRFQPKIILKSCELHPRGFLMSRRTHGLVPPTRRPVPNPSRRKAHLRCALRTEIPNTRCFFPSPSQLPSHANNLDPIHGSFPVGCALIMHAIVTQARERAVPAAQLATTLSARLCITPTQILLPYS